MVVEDCERQQDGQHVERRRGDRGGRHEGGGGNGGRGGGNVFPHRNAAQEGEPQTPHIRRKRDKRWIAGLRAGRVASEPEPHEVARRPPQEFGEQGLDAEEARIVHEDHEPRRRPRQRIIRGSTQDARYFAPLEYPGISGPRVIQVPGEAHNVLIFLDELGIPACEEAPVQSNPRGSNRSWHAVQRGLRRGEAPPESLPPIRSLRSAADLA